MADEVPDRVIELNMQEILERYRTVSTAIRALKKSEKRLTDELADLKLDILNAVGYDKDQEPIKELVLGTTEEGVPAVRVSIYPQDDVDTKMLKEYYPEVYSQCLKTSQRNRVTVL